MLQLPNTSNELALHNPTKNNQKCSFFDIIKCIDSSKNNKINLLVECALNDIFCCLLCFIDCCGFKHLFGSTLVTFYYTFSARNKNGDYASMGDFDDHTELYCNLAIPPISKIFLRRGN